MKHTQQQIIRRPRAAEIERRVQAAREQAIIRFVYRKRG
jgi:hypothetical protein